MAKYKRKTTLLLSDENPLLFLKSQNGGQTNRSRAFRRRGCPTRECKIERDNTNFFQHNFKNNQGSLKIKPNSIWGLPSCPSLPVLFVNEENKKWNPSQKHEISGLLPLGFWCCQVLNFPPINYKLGSNALKPEIRPFILVKFWFCLSHSQCSTTNRNKYLLY